MRVGLSHLCEDKFNDSFRELLIKYAIVTNILKIHFITFFTAQNIYKKGWRSLTQPVILFPIFQIWEYIELTELLYYVKEDLNNINNTSMLDGTINNLIETKWFDAGLLWCSRDVMALTLILLFNLIFLISFLFCFYCYYLFIIFRLSFIYIYIFVFRYVATCTCIPGDCKFFRLRRICYYKKQSLVWTHVNYIYLIN